jgi:hypothetical protein
VTAPRATRLPVLAVSLVIALGILGAGTLAASVSSPHPSLAAGTTAAPAVATVPRPAGAHGADSSGPDSGGWNSNFFHDLQVTFGGPSLSGQLQPVPYLNSLPSSTLGFYLNISSLEPLLFANVTIWGVEWPNPQGIVLPITGYSPVTPNVAPMQLNHSDPQLASYYFDAYRFFWPGSTVYFNLTAVGKNTTPSEIKSTTNVSVPIGYTGGYTNYATWAFQVDTPWASSNFTDDIAVTTSPNILGPDPTAPNGDQTFDVTLSSIALSGAPTPIPDALMQYTLIQNGTATSYSDPFGPINHTVMTLAQPLGPYPGATLQFNITAWLPWEGGKLDLIASPVFQFTWSTHGGWWFPTQGLLANLGLAASPDVLVGGVSSTAPTVIATDDPVNVSIHEPIQNVTISSAVVDFMFSDAGLNHSGAVLMTAVNQNTSFADLTGLPSGSTVTFYVVAKDINGNPVSSGNFSYVEAGPTAPPLPAGLGLMFLEVANLNGGGLVPGFTYTIANATWSAIGSANVFGFASPVLPGTGLSYRLGFGTYDVTVHVFGTVHEALITISASSPTPTVVFYAESSPLPIATTSSVGVESLAAGLGLAAAAIATIPLMRWLDERRERREQENRRITL